MTMNRGVCAVLLIAGLGHADVPCAQPIFQPESVDFHPRLDRYLVSNRGAGTIQTLDNEGGLDILVDIGSGLGSIELVSGVVIAVVGTGIEGYDVDTGQPVFENVSVQGSGLAWDGGSAVYVGSQNQIHRIDITDITKPFISATYGLGSFIPSGVAYDRINDRLLIGTWRQNAPILSVPLDGPNPEPFVLINTSVGFIDGVALDCNGALIVSAHSNCPVSGGCLLRFHPPFGPGSVPETIGQALGNPGDIDFAGPRGEVAVPEITGERITFVPIPECEASLLFGDFER
jgi:hypothetical protein